MDSNNPKILAPIPSQCTPYSQYCLSPEVFRTFPTGRNSRNATVINNMKCSSGAPDLLVCLLHSYWSIFSARTNQRRPYSQTSRIPEPKNGFGSNAVNELSIIDIFTNISDIYTVVCRHPKLEEGDRYNR